MRRALLGAIAVLLCAPAAASAPPSSSLTVAGSSYGRILFDGHGFVLYAFTHDPRGRSTCSGDCAGAWPPFIVRGRPSAGPGVSAKLLGTTTRRDGSRQVTYAGRPLYYYVGDRKPTQILCQNVKEFGGLWLVVRANGTLVR